MKQIVLLCALCALFGCKQATVPETEQIALYYATSEQSKTDILTQGDQIGIFAAVEGTENYFLENAQYVVGSDGRSLSTSPAVYYPEAKQAVAFTAYLPFGGVWNGAVGTFSVPADQSTSLKQADLCWAKASSTPVAAPVPLEFAHKMARLLITTNEPTSKIVVPNAFSGGTLDIKTGAFTNTLKSEVLTTGNELIVPAQPLTRLLLTVAGVEHSFAPASPINLPAGQTTTLNLTLNPITKTATLASTTTTAWSVASKTDEADRVVNNQFLAHWLVADYRFNQINRIGLTIKDQTSGVTKDYVVSQVAMVAGSTISSASYTFTLANVAELHYPYTVSAIKFYKDATLVHTATVGNVVARTGAATLGWGQNIALTLSAAKVSVAATVTSSTFTLTSNVPYGSTYTTGGASVQGVGAEPPYTNRSVVFTYPAQGTTAAAARDHVMTITPTVDYTGAPNKRTFTVTQAAVPTSLTLSATAPGEVVPRLGKIYTVNITSNTSWKSQGAVGGVTTEPASGTGSATGVKVIVPYTVANASATTRAVSINFVTTASFFDVSETTAKWSGTQSTAVPTNAILINGVWWATGNLIANGGNSCRIGASTDCGLYFQFGSLIGWSGGEAVTNYDGRGEPTSHTAVTKVFPASLNASFNPGGTWPMGGGASALSTSYFSINAAPYSTVLTEIWGYNGAPVSGVGVDLTRIDLLAGRYAPMGVGDPCRFYLGEPWRLPSVADVSALVGRSLGWGAAMVGTTTDHTATAWVALRAGQRLSGPWSYERINTTAWVGDRRPGLANECAIFETATIANGAYRIECHWHILSPNQVYFHGDIASTFGTRTHGVVVRCVQSL